MRAPRHLARMRSPQGSVKGILPENIIPVKNLGAGAFGEVVLAKIKGRLPCTMAIVPAVRPPYI